MKIAAITYSAPWGSAELFVTRELNALQEICPSMLIAPMEPKGELFHEISKPLEELSLRLPLISVDMIKYLLKFGISDTRRFAELFARILIKSKRPRTIIRNLAVLPKSIYVAKIFQERGISHIRVNWATTPATMAYIISFITGIPWSLRTHRWDIYEDNMLKEKVKSAEFVICNSEKTKLGVVQIAGAQYESKVYVKPLGMTIEPMNRESIISRIHKRRIEGNFHIVTPANLVNVKGHRYLLEACSLLRERGYKKYHLTLFGDGPLRGEINGMIDRLGLDDFVELHEAIPNNKLLDLYRNNHVDLVVLPSILTEEGEHEGFPNVLLEAMSFGIPVVSTNTGGIPELLADGAGILVNDKSGKELADAMERIMQDEDLAVDIALKERKVMEAKYSIRQTALWMLGKYNMN
jgi:glycosyltransferase involved in cell wall biosynthesis